MFEIEVNKNFLYKYEMFVEVIDEDIRIWHKEFKKTRRVDEIQLSYDQSGIRFKS